MKLAISLLILSFSFKVVAQNQCADIFSTHSSPRPYSTSPKDPPGFELTEQNLIQESYLFEWYVGGLENQRLDYAFNSYKSLDYRRMNQILRDENPDFVKNPPRDSEVIYKEILAKEKADPTVKSDGEAFYRLRLLDLAALIEHQIFPLGYTLSKEIVLYRAVALKVEQLPKVGTVYYDPAFMSTAIKFASQNFSGDAVGWKNVDQYLQVEFQITVGSFKGKVLPGVGSEREVLLPRNTPLKILSVEKGGRVIIIRAELMDPSDLR